MRYRVKNKKGMEFYVEAPEGASPEQISEAIRNQLDERAWNDLGIKQKLQEMEPLKREIRAEDVARERSLKTLDTAIQKKSDVEASTLEKEIRRLWAQEGAISKDMETAETAKDKAAYDKASRAAGSIGDRRDELLKKLEKVNPTKHKALYNELFEIKE